MHEPSDPTAWPFAPAAVEPPETPPVAEPWPGTASLPSAPDPSPDPVALPPMSPPPAPPFAGEPPRPAAGGGVSRGLLAVLAPVLAVVVFSAGVLFGRTGLPADAAVGSPTPAASGSDAALALVEQAWRDIQGNYVDAAHLDNQALSYAAIRGITQAVGDEGHTSFLTAAEVKAADQSLSGTFVGIGIQLAEKDKQAVIGAVIPRTPAEEAGLRRGDLILAVDGRTTSGETIEQTVSRIRGPEQAPVTLTIGRTGAASFDVTIVRRKFDLPLVSWAMVPGRKVALIRLDQFSTGATKLLQEAIGAARDKGATALILDLRDNPGGYVTEAIGVTSQFIGDGIVYQAFDASGTEKDAKVEPGGVATSIPLVVLANGGTASSAEIVTGAIQDAKRGTVVGEKTFGTGTVLGRFDLADGSSLRIGVERWLTRGGRPIWHEGLDPDVKVALVAPATPVVPADLSNMTADELAASTDVQLLRALEVLASQG